MQRDDRLRNRAELGIRTEHIPYITRNVLLSAQMGERASVVFNCIITSCYNEVK